jgi:hypothetical protein
MLTTVDEMVASAEFKPKEFIYPAKKCLSIEE